MIFSIVIFLMSVLNIFVHGFKFQSQCVRISRSSTVIRQFRNSTALSLSNADIPDVNELTNMKLNDLKDLCKQFGGKPGTLRKTELIDLCRSLMLAKPTTTTENKKPTIRAMPALSEDSREPIVTVKGQIGVVATAFASGDSLLTSPQTGSSSKRSFNSATMANEHSYDTTQFEWGGSVEVRNTTSGKRHWSRHPSGPSRDERLMDLTSLHSSHTHNSGTTGGNGGGGGGQSQHRHQPLAEASDVPVGMGDMDVTFLGTASCIPSLTRGVSCVAFRYNSLMWLFDCGESTQLQLQKSRVKASKIKKIFITHAHGDHSFGLPGVLCLLGQSTQEERERAMQSQEKIEPIDIYGPEGTRDLVRAVVQLTYSRVVAPHRIHELKNVPYLHGRSVRWAPTMPKVRTRFDPIYGEHEGGTDIYPDANGHYHLFDEDELRVQAAPMQHTIPCVGYVITEKTRPGRLKFDEVKEVVERNKAALKETLQLRDPNKIYAVLKSLQPGTKLTFPDGTVLNADEILDPPRAGRKVVLMGDTCSGDMIAPLAMDADLVIHEATNAWFREQDSGRHPTEAHLERDTYTHGHSTPQMAGKFSKAVRARKLVLTHFSPRYRGDDSDYSMKTMWRFEHMARKASGLWGRNDVIAAWDQLAAPIRNREDEDRIRDREQTAADVAHGITPGTRASAVSTAVSASATDEAAPALGVDTVVVPDLALASEEDEDEEDFIVPPLDEDSDANNGLFSSSGGMVSM